MTFEQKIKAIRAIAKQKGENPEIRISLELHKKAKKEAFELFSLPYRAYYDYLKRKANSLDNTIMLNPCYPEPGYPVDGIIKVDKSDFDIPKEYLSGSRTQEEVYCYEHLKPEIREQVDNIKNRFCTWSGDSFGNEQWQKYFLRFLKGYDFNSFTCFDMFGATIGEIDNNNIGAIDDSQIELLKKVYSRLQKKYEENPEKYEYKEPLYCEEYSYLYQDKPFILKITKDEAMERVELSKTINIPMSNEQISANLKKYGLDE